MTGHRHSAFFTILLKDIGCSGCTQSPAITPVYKERLMRAVMRFSERIVVLDAGNKIAEGSPDEIVANPDVERAYLGE